MTQLIKNTIIAAALVICFATPSLAQQTLANGYLVVPLAALSPNDRSIADMNDGGQVLASSLRTKDEAAIFDASMRLSIAPPVTFIFNDTAITVDSVNPFGLANDVTLAIGAFHGALLGETTAIEFTAKRRFAASNPVICGNWGPPCGISGSGSSWTNSIATRGSGPFSGDIEFRSINKRTNEVMFVGNSGTQIYSWTEAGLQQVISIQELPPQYRSTPRFFPLFEGFKRNNTQGVLNVFDNGAVAFVTVDSVTSRTALLEADKNKNVRELFFEIEGSGANFAINDARQIAFVQSSDTAERSSGVYIHDLDGTRVIHTITNRATTRYGQHIDINDSGEIVFDILTRESPTVEYRQIMLWDPRNESLTPLATDMPPQSPGDSDQLYLSQPIDSWAFNNRGQLALAATKNQITRGEPIEFFRLDPPGASVENVILPSPICSPNRFCIPGGDQRVCGMDGARVVLCQELHDPVIAIGFDYESKNPDSNFAAVAPPIIGDNQYDLFLWNSVQQDYLDSGVNLLGGEAFEFSTIGFADGVDRFSLRGIETDANLDPDDPHVFVTGVRFAELGGAKATEMIPVRFDTDAVAPTVTITAPSNGTTLFANSFPAGVTASFTVGHDPLSSVTKASLAIDGAPIASATRPFAGGACAPSTVEFDSCGVSGLVGTLGDRFVVNSPGAYEISATAETDGGPGAARSTVSVATVNVEYPAPPSIANAYINLRYKKMSASCRGAIITEIASRHASSSAYGPRGGPYDENKIRSDVDALKLQHGC